MPISAGMHDEDKFHAGWLLKRADYIRWTSACVVRLNDGLSEPTPEQRRDGPKKHAPCMVTLCSMPGGTRAF